MMTASCTIGISSFQCQALTKCQCNKNSAKGVAVMRRGGSSWLASVKSAFRSPSKHCEKTQELDEDNSKVPSWPHSRESLSVMLPPLPFLSHIFCSQKRKVKRRCFFRKPSRHKQQLPLKQSPPPPSPLPEQRHAIAAAVISPSLNREYYAAIVIQTAFRAYLARRALRALKGLVKLQALVRGHNVRKQANMTLQCMQSLVRVQNRVLDQRIRLSLSHYAAPRQILERRSLKSREGLVTEEIQAIQKSRREAAIKREKLNSYAFSHQNWRSDCNLCLMNGELGGDPESRIWLDRWLASRKSFDNRSRSRGAEALEIDTAQPCSYATPRRQPHYNRHHLSSPRHSSPATPPPSPPLPEWRRSMAAHSSAKARAMPNYMSATESAKTRLRLQSSPRRRPGTPARERVGSAKKQLAFPAPEEYGARSPSIKNAMGRLVSEQRSNVSSSCAESFDGESLSSSTTDLRRWLR